MLPPSPRLKLSLAGLSALIALFAVEAVLRVTKPLKVPLRSRIFTARVADGRAVELPSMPMARGLQRSDPRLEFELAPSLSFEIRYDAGEQTKHPYMRFEDGWFILDVETNAAAMRGPMPALERDASVRRVACIGDSFTFGDGVNFEDTWVAGLGSAFESAGGLQALEVLDFGVPGYESGDIALQLEDKVLPLKPDLVVYGMVLNDPTLRTDPELNRLGEAAAAALLETIQPHTGLARLSHIAALIQTRQRMRKLEATYRRFVRARFSKESASWQAFVEDLEHMQALTAAADAKLIVCIFPLLDSLVADYPFTAQHKQVEQACAKLGIPAVNLLSAFDGQRAADLWVHPTDQHPNPRGHQLAQAAIAKALASREDELVP